MAFPSIREDISAMMKGTGTIPEIDLDVDPELNELTSDLTGETHEQEADGREEGQRGSDSDAGEREEGEVAELSVEEAATVSESELTDTERYNNLLIEYNKAAERLLALEGRHVTPVSETPALSVTPTPAVVAPVEFTVDETLLSKALIEDDPAAMKQVLTGLVEYVRQLAPSHDALRAQYMQDAAIVADKRFAMAKAVDSFYTENEVLRQYMPIIGTIVKEIGEREPTLPLGEVLAKVETEAYRRLGLRKQLPQPSGKKAKPAFAKSGNSGRSSREEPLSGKKKEMAEMAAAHGRY